MKLNYKRSRLPFPQWLLILLLGTGSYLAGDFLLYRSTWVLLGLPAFLGIFCIQAEREYTKRRMQRFREHFLILLSSFVVSLRAGYAAENAIEECRQDLIRSTGVRSDLVQELSFMKKQLLVNVPLEKLFADLGERSGQEAVQNFAEVFAIGKRSGGNLEEILSLTFMHLRQQMEMQKDIEAETASRRMELKVMSLVPWGMLLYLELTSPSYMEVLFTTTAGRITATAALLLYMGAFLWGRRITGIEGFK